MNEKPASDKQRKLINGLVHTIADYTGYGFDEFKMYAKRMALSRGYPLMERDGAIVYMDDEPMPESETRITSDQASALIETLYQLGAECGALYQE